MTGSTVSGYVQAIWRGPVITPSGVGFSFLIFFSCSNTAIGLDYDLLQLQQQRMSATFRHFESRCIRTLGGERALC